MATRESKISISRNPTFVSELWLYGVIVTGLIAISNLILLIILGNIQMLFISAGNVLVSGIFLASRWSYRKNWLFLSLLFTTIAWAGIFLIHAAFWSGILVYLLVGIWMLPLVLFFLSTGGAIRFSLFLPSVLSVFAILFLEFQSPVYRLSVIEFSISRFIAPIYFLIIGIFVFLIILRGINFRLLSLKMIMSMALIIFIPIVILTLVSYSNTKLDNSLTATKALNQIAERKSEAVNNWAADLSIPLTNLINENDTYQLINRLLLAYSAREESSIEAYQASLQYILSNITARYGFEEIFIIDLSGFVAMSTQEDYLGSDLSEYEMFTSGLESLVTIPPSYFPLEDQVSIFISQPVLSPSGEILGVLSGRANVDKMIALTTEPVTDPYETTTSYLLNSDGTFLVSSLGRSDLIVNTLGAQTVINTKASGDLSYENIEGQPVLGVFRWLPDLHVAILVEASQAEIFQRLPGIITGNLLIGLVGFVLAIVASVTIVRSITNPINDLVDASTEVIAGNFNIQLPTGREDELGTLTDAFTKMTGEIKVLVSDLEIRVADRTRDLESRSQELQIAAVIARDASLASSMNDLLFRTAQLIQEQFGFYHVGIFLDDEKNEYAVLSAAAGDAGQVMLENKHKLKIGETGMVGTVTFNGEPRIAHDVGVDAIYFQNPLLPRTRSEMTLPLTVGRSIIGALDVQSEKVSAFDQSDITIMSIITDQLAIAIERTRLLEDTTKNAEQLKLALQSQTSSAWQEYLNRSGQQIGYLFEGVSVKPLNRPINLVSGDAVSIELLHPADALEKPGCKANVPIKLRGLIIGSLEFQFSTNSIPSETRQFLEVAADRLSLALENARLFSEVTLRAEREKTISEITTTIRSTSNPQEMLRTAASELQKVLGAKKIEIHEYKPLDQTS